MHPTTPWCRQDLFFLEDSLRSGSSFGEVAGFLSRCEDEVREKAEELGIAKVLGLCQPSLRSPDKLGALRPAGRGDGDCRAARQGRPRARR